MDLGDRRQRQGCRVLVAHPLRPIYEHERKSHRRDAQMLARIGRLDPALLYPVWYGTAEAQRICCGSTISFVITFFHG